ncbi:hypothetical protein LCGC14_0463770 [marine sediment metagenome]|uniref:Glycosyltransferase 2-like domain-containing protein n=1 Tax=marine sediment metagenome TaxID=412755 RepID=A0A0F9SJH8_9ZZZZ
MIQFSVLICTIEKRETRFKVLMAELNSQTEGVDVQVLSKCDAGEMSIGEKRNWLLDHAKGEWLCYVDDDDWIDKEYISIILKALETNPDVVQMIGIMNTDGFNKKRFEHSLRHWGYFEQCNIFYRPPNHLNPIRSSIAKQFRFPETNHGEDTDWALQIRNSGLLVTEEMIDRPIYHYRYSSVK